MDFSSEISLIIPRPEFPIVGDEFEFGLGELIQIFG